MLTLARRYDQAIEQKKKTLELNPSFPPAYWPLGVAYEQKGMFKEAIVEFQKAIALERSPIYMAGWATPTRSRVREVKRRKF